MKFITTYSLFFFSLLFFGFSASGQVSADFTASPTSGCTPLLVSFNNTSAGASSYTWQFNNGDGVDHLVDPSTTFLNDTDITLTYTVTLTAYNGTDSSKHSVVITVYPLPKVNFVASDTTVCLGTPITFTSTTIGGVPGPIAYTWNYGDGTGNTGNPVSHTFTAAGNYNITLYATNAEGCHADTTINADIHVLAPPVPTISLASSVFCGLPANAEFSGSASGTPPFTYRWTFGDGSGTFTGSSITHAYTSGGTYEVSLTVSDGIGCTATDSMPITITIIPPISASFVYPDTACIFSAVTFTNTSATFTSSYWTFGDGNSSSATSGTNTYGSTGLKTVTLVITDGPCTDTVSHTIYIRPAPVASIIQNPVDPCPPPVAITFTGSVPIGDDVSWIYGDGSTGSGTTVTHTYSSRGVYDISMIVTDPVTGCRDTINKVDTLYDLYLSLIGSPDSGCAPLTVHFSDSLYTYEPPPVTGARKRYPWGAASYSWTFGDGGTSTLADPVYTYLDSGVYVATLTVTTANGCVVSATDTIKVGYPPNVVFRGDTNICAGHSSIFVDSIISGPVDYYVWSGIGGFNDTTTLDYYDYWDSIPGIYTVTMTPYYRGCAGLSHTLTIDVDSPKAIIRDSIFCAPPTDVQFWDKSYGDDSHTWIFGDGTTSTLSNPLHTYGAISTYTVTLATYNSRSGCRDTVSLVVSLVKPIPNFAAPVTRLCIGVADTVTATVTGGSATLYEWYVNGTSEGGGARLTYPFTDTGEYTIRLIIEDQNHCFDTVTRTDYILVAHPYVNFTESPTSGCVPLTVTFTDHTRDVGGATFTSFLWSFGDGHTVTGSSTATHIYTTSGTFTTKEVVTDNLGCTDTLQLSDTAVIPNASFTAVSLFPCPGAPVFFTNTSTGYTSSLWSFGDGSSSILTDPTHAYANPGLYTVRLIVTDIHGCADTAIDSNYIDVTRPVASFYMSDSFAICPPLNVDFVNTSTGATSYNWWLGDGSTTTLTDPTDYYVAVGEYTVTLVATNVYGCTDTAYGHPVIFGYAGAFSYTPDSGCAPLTVHFTAVLNNVPTIVWDFSDGNTDSVAFSDTITHVYLLPGAYVPRLIISDNTGCAASSVGLDTIKVDAVTAGFTTIPDPICQNGTINFKDTSTGYWDPVDTWIWTFTDGDTSRIQDPPYSYTAVGTYPVTLYVMDEWGCTATVTETVTVYPPAVITVSPDTTICLGDAATLTGYGGVEYWWSPSSTVSCSPCNPTLASPTTVTTYTVSGKDSHGCINTDTVTVRLKNATYSVGKGDTAICKGVTVQLFDSGATHFTWIPGTGLSSAVVWDPLASPQATTIYTVIAQLGNCIPDTNTITVIVYPLPTVDAGPDQTVVAGSTAQLNATGTDIASIMWQEDKTLSCLPCYDPVASMSATTTYFVDVTSPHGCKGSDSVTIHLVCEQGQVWLPNAFTPNNDGNDDIFYIRGKGISSIKSFRIYNRWGNLLFEREGINVNDATNGWDGSYEGNPQHPDVYVYVIEAICDLGSEIFIKGDVTIIR